jgi:hypothetical protein
VTSLLSSNFGNLALGLSTCISKMLLAQHSPADISVFFFFFFFLRVDPYQTLC